MKNTIKILGLIALLAIVGFSMVSCSEDTGTVDCINTSGANVTMYLCQGDKLISTISTVPNDYKGQWTHVLTGSNYKIIIGSLSSDTFKVEKDKTVTINYNGTTFSF